VALGVSEGAVSQWIKQGREGGEKALKAHPAKGATPRLTAEQKAHIPTLLAKAAPAYGFVGEVWNSRRLAQVIKQEFKVSYHPDHCGRLSARWGTVYKNRWNEQHNVMRRQLKTGKNMSGLL
jgi:transposase